MPVYTPRDRQKAHRQLCAGAAMSRLRSWARRVLLSPPPRPVVSRGPSCQPFLLSFECSTFNGSVTVILTDANEDTTNAFYSKGSGIVKDASLKISLSTPKGMFKGSSVTVGASGKW
jgi:hypothetical protein